MRSLAWALIQHDWCPWRKRRSGLRPTEGRANEDTVRRWPPTSWGLRPLRTSSNPQNWETINFCCLNHPICGPLLRQPEQGNKVTSHHPSSDQAGGSELEVLGWTIGCQRPHHQWSCRDGLLRPPIPSAPCGFRSHHSKRTSIAESGLKKTIHSAAEIDTAIRSGGLLRRWRSRCGRTQAGWGERCHICPQHPRGLRPSLLSTWARVLHSVGTQDWDKFRASSTRFKHTFKSRFFLLDAWYQQAA